MIKQVPDLQTHFSDLEEDAVPDRTFMWTILCTIKVETCKTLIDETREKRSKKSENNNDNEEFVEIHQDFIDQLLITPQIGRGWCLIIIVVICIESGRVVFLLKSACPARFHRSAPKEYKANMNLLVSPQVMIREHRHKSNDAQEV